MDLSLYTTLVFLHLLLFAYWLGPDWGVFVCGRRIADPSLSKAERLRFLQASVAIDFFPRSAIVLLTAVGLTLADLAGYMPLGTVLLTLVWLTAAAWLLLVWFTGYILAPGPLRERLASIHLWLRHLVTLLLIAVGVLSLVLGSPVAATWLAVKFLLVGILIAMGSVLRVIVLGWVRELTDVPGAEGTIARSYPYTRKLVITFWLVSIAIAFLAVTKPL